jgi:hypothetical protein
LNFKPPAKKAQVVGVDRISVSYPVGRAGFDRESEDWARREQVRGGVERFSGYFEIGPRCTAFVGVEDRPDRDTAFVKIECNPSRLVDPDGWSVAPAAAASMCVGEVLSLVGGELVALPVEGLGSLRLRRLDAARDFGEVEVPGQLIRGLAPIPRAWARLNLVHADPSKNRAQTLMVGSRTSGVARLYDKHQESEGRAPVGSVRFEAECRRAWCHKYGGMERLGDVNNGSVAMLARERWEWSGMGSEIFCSGVALLEALDLAGLSPAKKRAFVGWLLEQSVGVPSPIGKQAASDYRRIQRQLGIVAADMFGGQGGKQVFSRLDFDSGTEVRRVA